MESDLYQNLLNFMKKEKLTLNLSKNSDQELWLDGPEKKITVKILIDAMAHEISYDVYSVIDARHLREKTLRDTEKNVYIQEEHRRWKTAEVLEEVWMIIDEMEIWSEKNKYLLKEAELI
jgi:hypothetical protein